MKKKILTILAFLIFLSGCQHIDKKDKIEKLLIILDTDKRIEKMLNELIEQQFKSSNIEDSSFWISYKTKFLDIYNDSIKPKLSSVYDKYFTEDEIDLMYNFYKTKTGKQTLVKIDSFFIETTKMTTMYAQNIATQIINEQNDKIKNEINHNMNDEFSDCEKFRIGKFKLVLKDETFIYIERNYEKQIETYGNGKTILKINWLNDCRYELILEQTNNPYLSDRIGEKMIFNIYEKSTNSYKYSYQVSNDPEIYEGELIKIE